MSVAKIKEFYARYFPLEDKIILLLLFATIAISFSYMLVNLFITHYSGEFYIPLNWLLALPVIIALYLLALYSVETAPRVAFFTRSYTLYFYIFVAMALLTTGLQYSPFPLIDKSLVKLDVSMGFHTVAVLNWTYAHPRIQQLMNDVYATTGYQLFFVPLIIAILADRKCMSVYFFSIIASYLIGSTIYYFFPTAGPAYIFHSPHFMQMQHDTYLKYFEVHHRQIVTTFEGGMIAFPSFHVIWSILLTYALIRRWWLFIPFLILNGLVIASTFLLAWHYLTDVIGGFIVAAISIWIAEISVKKLQAPIKV